jgi:hypothetical protein
MFSAGSIFRSPNVEWKNRTGFCTSSLRSVELIRSHDRVTLHAVLGDEVRHNRRILLRLMTSKS